MVVAMPKRDYVPVEKKGWVVQHIPKHARIDEVIARLESASSLAVGNASTAIGIAVHALYVRLVEQAEALTEADYMRAIETYADVTRGNRHNRAVYLKKPTLDELTALGAYFAEHYPNTPYMRGGDNRRVLIVIALMLFRLEEK